MLGPVTAWMGDRLRAGKQSRYVTSHPGQLSLAIPPWVGTEYQLMLGRSGVLLAMRHRQQWPIHLWAQRPMWGRWAPRLHNFWGMALLYLYATCRQILQNSRMTNKRIKSAESGANIRGRYCIDSRSLAQEMIPLLCFSASIHWTSLSQSTLTGIYMSLDTPLLCQPFTKNWLKLSMVLGWYSRMLDQTGQKSRSLRHENREGI